MVLICVSLVTSDVGRLSRLVQGHPASQALCPFSDGQSVSWSRQGRRSVWGLAPSAPSLRRPGLLRGAFFPAPESAGGSAARPSRGLCLWLVCRLPGHRIKELSPRARTWLWSLPVSLWREPCRPRSPWRTWRRRAAWPSQGSVGLQHGRAGCCFVLKPRPRLLDPIRLPHPAWPENSLFSPRGELARSVHQGSPPVPLLGWDLRKLVKS